MVRVAVVVVVCCCCCCLLLWIIFLPSFCCRYFLLSCCENFHSEKPVQQIVPTCKKNIFCKRIKPPKNKKYLQMKRRHQTVSRNWLSQWKKTHKATFFTSTHDAFLQDGQILLNLINSVPTRNRVFVVVGRDRHRPSLQPFLFFVSANSFFDQIRRTMKAMIHRSIKTRFGQNLFISIFSPKFFTFSRKMKTEPKQKHSELKTKTWSGDRLDVDDVNDDDVATFRPVDVVSEFFRERGKSPKNWPAEKNSGRSNSGKAKNTFQWKKTLFLENSKTSLSMFDEKLNFFLLKSSARWRQNLFFFHWIWSEREQDAEARARARSSEG